MFNYLLILSLTIGIIKADNCDLLEQECWRQCGQPAIFPFRETCKSGPDLGVYECRAPPGCTCIIPMALRTNATYYARPTQCITESCSNYDWTRLYEGWTRWCQACGYDCGGNQAACIANSELCLGPARCGSLQLCRRWRENACINGEYNGITCDSPTPAPTLLLTPVPTLAPTHAPTQVPTPVPTIRPTLAPTQVPTSRPTLSVAPTQVPTSRPTLSVAPTQVPTSVVPTQVPTARPTSQAPTHTTTHTPSQIPTQVPSQVPTQVPSQVPTQVPSQTTTQVQSPIPSQSTTQVLVPVPVPGVPPTSPLIELEFKIMWYITMGSIIYLSITCGINQMYTCYSKWKLNRPVATYSSPMGNLMTNIYNRAVVIPTHFNNQSQAPASASASASAPAPAPTLDPTQAPTQAPTPAQTQPRTRSTIPIIKPLDFNRLPKPNFKTMETKDRYKHFAEEYKRKANFAEEDKRKANFAEEDQYREFDRVRAGSRSYSRTYLKSPRPTSLESEESENNFIDMICDMSPRTDRQDIINRYYQEIEKNNRPIRLGHTRHTRRTRHTISKHKLNPPPNKAPTTEPNANSSETISDGNEDRIV